MPITRKSHPPSLKAKVAVEAIKSQKTTSQIAQIYAVHPTQVGGWKKQALDGLPDIFGNGREQVRQQFDAEKDELYKQIGQLKVELDFLKKRLDSCAEIGSARVRQWIEPAHSGLTIRQQCDLLELPQSTYYYHPQPESAENLRLLRRLDELYLQRPYFGSRRMAVELEVNRKRIQRLMRILGIEAHYPKPNLSRRHPDHKIYPYLLRGVSIERPNQVWSTDITYIPMRGGFLYLVAVMDWYSRFVLSWELSNTMETAFCLTALDAAFRFGQPDIWNSDQGAQFTSVEFLTPLQKRGIAISMDGRGRALDNVFIERLWRSLKYELIYPGDFSSGRELYPALESYFHFYNHQRPHQSLGYQTPAALFPGASARKSR